MDTNGFLFNRQKKQIGNGCKWSPKAFKNILIPFKWITKSIN